MYDDKIKAIGLVMFFCFSFISSAYADNQLIGNVINNAQRNVKFEIYAPNKIDYESIFVDNQPYFGDEIPLIPKESKSYLINVNSLQQEIFIELWDDTGGSRLGFCQWGVYPNKITVVLVAGDASYCKTQQNALNDYTLSITN